MHKATVDANSKLCPSHMNKAVEQCYSTVEVRSTHWMRHTDRSSRSTEAEDMIKFQWKHMLLGNGAVRILRTKPQ